MAGAHFTLGEHLHLKCGAPLKPYVERSSDISEISRCRQSNHDTYDTSGLANLRPGWSVSRTPYDVTDLYHNRGQQPQPFAVQSSTPT